MITIGEVTHLVPTWNPRASPDAETMFTYIDLSAIDNKVKEISAVSAVRCAEAPSRARQVVASGDVLVSTVRPNLNAVAMVPPALDGATASTGFAVLRPSAAVHRRYLFHWVRSSAFIAEMVRNATGASYPAVSDRIVKASTIPLPSLDEQRRIAEILDQADRLRAKRCRALGYLEDLSQSIFISMFGGESFPQVVAGDVMPSMRNGLSPATAGEHLADVLTLSAVTRGAFDPTAVKVGLFAVNPPEDKRVSALDFLMCRGNGNKGLVGAGVFSSEDRPDLVFPDTVIAGRIDKGMVTMPFLNAVWKQRAIRGQIEALARTTNGTYKVNQQALSSVTVSLPPLRLQREFDVRVERVATQRALSERASLAEDQLFASLQARAFGGVL